MELLLATDTAREPFAEQKTAEIGNKTMNWRTVLTAVFFWMTMTIAAQAQTVILVQGYLGSAGSWRASGITVALQQGGWPDGGHLRAASGGGILHYGKRLNTTRRFFTIDLPTEAPVALQASILSRYIAFARRLYPAQPVMIVAHSAGGVVARFVMVTNRAASISSLITIASPHLGTQIAQLGSAIANSPISWFAPMFGANTINRSAQLYNDLSPERPGNLLGWLNRQPHPPARYISVIRVRDVRNPNQGDNLVYGWSQDMNTVPALRGKARTLFSPGTHDLRPSDGPLLANLLNGLAPPGPAGR